MANSTLTTVYAPLWVPEPNGRGTWSILYSCVFTLTLCVWSAIHQNIPRRGEGKIWQWLRKTKWVFIAIFAPELVLYSAWQQYYLAQRFRKDMMNIWRVKNGLKEVKAGFWWEDSIQRCVDFLLFWHTGRYITVIDALRHYAKRGNADGLLPLARLKNQQAKPEIENKPEISLPGQINDFSLTYGYFVVMGGFVVNVREFYDTSETRQSNANFKNGYLYRMIQQIQNITMFRRIAKPLVAKQLAKNKKASEEDAFWMTLTTRGVLELAKTLPWDDFTAQFCLDEESIRDKSKADSLAKMLVSLQVLWAILNSTSRLALGYPITVLEIHTLVHAACALLMYALWWKKPMDIQNSIIIKTDNFRHSQAFREKLALMLIRHPGSAYRPFTNFEMPNTWARFVSWEEPYPLVGDCTWPNRRYGCEAAFLCFDSAKLSNVPYPSDPEKKSDGESYAILDPQTRSPSELPDVMKDRSGTQPHADRVDEQAKIETNAGIDSHSPPSTDDKLWTEPVCRLPNAKAETVCTLSTGEFLLSGVGPAAFITKRKLMASYARRIRRERPDLSSVTVAVVDESLKPRICIPVQLEDWKPELAYYHKVTIQLSDRDKLRWQMACSAFISELTEVKHSKDTSALRETSVTIPSWSPDEHPEPEHAEVAQSDHCNRCDTEDNRSTASGKGAEAEASAQQPASGSPAKLLSLQKKTLDADGAAAFSISGFCMRSRNLDMDSLGRLTDWRRLRQVKSYFGFVMYVVISLISGIYAAIHLALWNHDFPTHAELLLWRVCAITLAAPAIILVVMVSCAVSAWNISIAFKFAQSLNKYKAFAAIYAEMRSRWVKIEEFWTKAYKESGSHVGYWCVTFLWIAFLFVPLWIVGCVLIVASPFGLILYGFARIYIVAESFLSLRHVPIGVYQDVSWAQYVPHL